MPCFAEEGISALTQYIADKHVATIEAVDYASAIISSSEEFKISWKWYAAIIYRENQFSSIRTDGKGSFGISQMQVQTAKAVAKELGDSQKKIDPVWIETHPLAMIRYGARHFHDLLREFRGPNQYYWATRAYNAGGTRIHLAMRGAFHWRHLSEKYYDDVDTQYRVIAKYLADEAGKN